MAEVFICVERQLAGLERLVVVKRILPHLAVHESFVEMFQAEARYTINVNHPNVVKIHELGEDGGLPYLSMEYVPGCSLRDLLVAAIESGRPLPAGVGVGLAIQACAGAHAAHELTDARGRPLGLVHRDISPHNLMVTVDGHVKLLDFGIAKATEDSGLDNTRTGTLKGKVHYMAPEQCRQEPLDRRADVFALGVVAWELLASERLFKRDSELEAMQAIVAGNLRDLRAIRKDLPTIVVAAVEKALQPRKEARFQTADVMKRALVDAVRGFDTSPEAIAAFLKPLLGEELEKRRQGFLDASRLRRPPRDLSTTRTGTQSRSFVHDDEGDSTVADKPGAQRVVSAAHERIGAVDDPAAFDDLADMETVRARGGFPTEGPPASGGTAQTVAEGIVPASQASQPSQPSLPSLPGVAALPSKRRPWLTAVAVAALSCTVVLGVLLVPRLRGSSVSGPPLVLAWPPTVEPALLQQELQVLDRLLEEATHRPVEIRLQPSYDAVVTSLKDGSAAFGVLPPFLFVSARREIPGLVPLATKLVDGSAGSDGVILVREDSDITTLSGLAGKTFCYPDKKSTSGYLLPRAAMRQAGLDPDVDVVAHFSGHHTQVIKDLANNVCSAGATYSGGYLAADRAGIKVARTRQLAITGRSPQDMVVASPTAASTDRAILGAALLALDPKTSLGQETVGVLERISGFTVPRLADYDALEKLLPATP
jgi:serine/threonine-protein kinase